MPSMATGFDYRDDMADFMHESAPCVSALEFLAETGTAGDPYSMPMAVRSVAAVAEGPTMPTGFAGDFYSMSDEVYRDASTHDLDEIPLQRADAGRFSSSYAPPKAPEDEAFEFELTTLFMSSSAPADLANEVLSFLEEADGVSIKKVDQQKFTVKTTSDSDSGACTLEVHFYAQTGNRFAIEFQRREGDSMALNDVFQKALEHFKERLLSARAESPRPAPGPAPKAAASPASQKPEQRAVVESSELALLKANFTTQISPTRPALSKSGAAKGRPLPQQSNRTRRSVPAPTNRLSESVQSSPARLSESMVTGMEPPTTIVAGSALNAARWRSKSSAGGRRLSNTRLVAAGARAISTA